MRRGIDMKAKKLKSKSPIRASRKVVESLKEVLKDEVKNALTDAVDGAWEAILEDLKGSVYANLGGYDHAILRIVDGCSGGDWWESKVSDLVTEYIDWRDGTVSENEPAWCDAIAADLEKQAQRLRKHAESLRS